MYELLDTIRSPADLKRLTLAELETLAGEVRAFLVATVSKTGGHLASNLGVVELTIAMLYVYDVPQDKIVWDVGHQSYVYKLLTNRRERMALLRHKGGVGGFPNTDESRFDAFDTGHATTAISAALGLARARDMHKGKNAVVAVVGDGAMTGGMAWEALNDLTSQQTAMTVVLNDNKMAISKNVGGLSRHLGSLRISKGYMRFKSAVLRVAKKVPPLYRFLKSARDGIKLRLVHGRIFEELGLKYIGPVDGHDLRSLISTFESIRDLDGAQVLLHVVTTKGKGDPEAEALPELYHGIGGNTEEREPMSVTLGHELVSLAERDARVVAVTAAMRDGTGLGVFAEAFPQRFFDVAIAEQHAVTMAAGMAAGGAKPFVALYSTFLQRAYDQILHDVCLPDLPVTFCIDRAGVADGDGATHNGLYDASFLVEMPNMTVLTPKNDADLRAMLNAALASSHPVAIRYPKYPSARTLGLPAGRVGAWEQLRSHSDRNAIVMCADMLDAVLGCDALGVIFAACLSALDTALLDTLYGDVFLIGDSSAEALFDRVTAHFYGRPDAPCLHRLTCDIRTQRTGSKRELLADAGMTSAVLSAKIADILGNS